ncbi:MAG TPA: hypothetical protein VEB40_10900 [Flavipsychrobacter sp.]|nr:hypothetical protein [Flavipsychrobacter sp.]
MPRWLKLFLKISVGVLALVVILWLGIAGYVNLNKKSVLKEITEQLNENIDGKLTIESMEPTLIRGFPGVSIELKNVLLRDNLWSKHRHDLLKAKNIYVSVNAFSIVRGKPRIRELSIEDGEIYLFTDSTGYSNSQIFKRRKETSEDKNEGRPRITDFNFKNIQFAFENKTKFKLFLLDIHRLRGNFNYTTEGWEASAKVNALIKNFAFNINSGSFLINQILDATLLLGYNKTKEVLTVPMQNIRLNKDELQIGAKFFLKEKPTTFEVNIRSDGILYRNAVAFVSPNISRNLKLMDLEKPIELAADIKGRMKFRDTPLVKVSWVVEDNTFIVPGGKITETSFRGNYINEVNPIGGHNDRNSRIDVYGMTGKYYDIPFMADSLQVTNLVQPTLEGRFKSKFQLEKVAPLLSVFPLKLPEGKQT